MTEKAKYLFGPVPSRRFGCSLGVDMVPFKTCGFDCIFCQLGATGFRTLVRREYVPTADVLGELGSWFDGGGKADFVTLAGSGEPTLHSRFGDVFGFVRKKSDVRTALLTNGTTLVLPEVREAAAGADVVKISLSAWDQASLERINRPCAGVDFDAMVSGMREFRLEYGGEIWLEVFLAAGVNDDPESVRRIAGKAGEIRPDRVHLNTAVRPAPGGGAEAVPDARMVELAGLFSPRAEVIADFGGGHVVSQAGGIEEMVRRHPSTVEQIAVFAGMTRTEACSVLEKLAGEGKVVAVKHGNCLYYASPVNSAGAKQGRART